MSGGSYDYFYSRAPGQLDDIATTLISMSERCADTGAWGREGADAADLAKVSSHLVMLSLKARALAVEMREAEQILHDVEWWRSGDSGPDEVVKSYLKMKAQP